MSSSSYSSNQRKRSADKSATARAGGFGSTASSRNEFSINEQPQNNKSKQQQEVIDLLDSDDEEEDNISVYQDDDDDSIFSESDDDRKPSALRTRGNVAGSSRPEVSSSTKRKNRTWDESFALLVKYKQHHGTTLVPVSDPQLGKWVDSQRQAYSRKHRGVKPSSGMIWISDVHEERLKSIGFSWTARLDAAVAGGQNDEDEELGDEEDVEDSSISDSDDSVFDLNDLDKKPSASRGCKGTTNRKKLRSWDECFQLLLKYKERHGNTLVPTSDPHLGTWVQNQRAGYSRKQRGVEDPKRDNRWISDEHEEQLRTVGFSWTARPAVHEGEQATVNANQEQGEEEEEKVDTSDYSDDDTLKMASTSRKKKKRSWEESFELLLEYKSRKGHTRVPRSDSLLGKWVTSQRQAYSRKQRGAAAKKWKGGGWIYHISQEHEEALDEIGFLWNVPSQSPQGSRASGSPVDEEEEEDSDQEEGVSMMSRDTTQAVVKPSTGPAAQSDEQKAAATMSNLCQHEPSTLSTQLRKRHRSMEDLQQEHQSNSVTAMEVAPETMCFPDIVGHGNAKSCIEDILLSLVPPVSVDDPIATRIRSQPTSIFLHGPTGCGKTRLARAIAGEAKAAFLSVAPSGILGKPMVELETAIQSIVQQARDCASEAESKCAVILFDQVDAFGSQEIQSDQDAGRSRRVLAELCNQLDTLHQQKQQQNQSKTMGQLNILIVAATNCRQHCDPALLRRFGARLHIGLPSESDRREMLKRKLSQVDNVLSQDQLLDITNVTEGWSGADVESLVHNASMAPIREYLRAARERRQQLQQTGGTLSVTDEGMNADSATMEHQSHGLRPVELADFEEAYHRS